MPDSTLSQAIKEAYASAPADEVIYHTLQMDHPAFAQPLRVVRDQVDLVATLETGGAPVTFIGYPFDVTPPEINALGSPQVVIEIDNVSREILAAIESAMATTDLLTVTYRQYLDSDLSGPQNNPPLTLTVFSISATVFRIKAVAGYSDVANRRFPGAAYSADVFPGLIAQ